VSHDPYFEDGSLAPGQLVDAASVARMLGVSRDWVYEHATDLGAIRLGTGRRPRLRFDPRVVAESLANGLGTQRGRRRSRRFRRAATTSDVELLPIAGVRFEGTSGQGSGR
jgi:hypothetical protein